MTYDKDLNAEHEVYGYVIRHHRRPPNSKIEKKRGIVDGSPRKNNFQISVHPNSRNKGVQPV